MCTKEGSHSVLAYWKIGSDIVVLWTGSVTKFTDIFPVCIVEIFPSADAVVEAMDGPLGVELSEIKTGGLPFLFFYHWCVVESRVDVCSLLASFF